MHVDNPSENRSILVSVENFSPKDRETMKVDVRLRGGQEKRDHLQNLGIALRGVIESRGIDEDHRSPLEGEFVGNLDLGSTRIQGHSDR